MMGDRNTAVLYLPHKAELGCAIPGPYPTCDCLILPACPCGSGGSGSQPKLVFSRRENTARCSQPGPLPCIRGAFHTQLPGSSWANFNDPKMQRHQIGHQIHCFIIYSHCGLGPLWIKTCRTILITLIPMTVYLPG